MRIFRQAITKQIKEQVSTREELPFNNIFDDDNLRIVIPIQRENIQYILKSLKHGQTKTGTKYKVDLDNKIAYRLIKNENGDAVLDPRPIRLGKVIHKELGDKWADAWSVESSSEDSEGKSIILSRSPVDVVRMSDHTWESCHSPGQYYFDSAIQEAVDGGAVAYVVNNQDIDDFIKLNGNDERVLQSEEIFMDDDRNVEGIVPLSRIRVNRYISDDGNELALPVTRTYGEKASGFLDTVTDWLKEKQSPTINYDRLNLLQYERTGGEYADDPDRKIMTNFFGDAKGVTNDLPHKGGESRLNIWDAELYHMQETINEKLNHSIVHYSVDEEDHYVFIYGYGYVDFAFRGYIEDDTHNDLIADLFNDYESVLQVNYCGHIDEVGISNENGIVSISLKIIMDQNDSINDPDDWEGRAESFVYYEETFYDKDVKELKSILIEKNILESIDQVDDAESYWKNQKAEAKDVFDYTNDVDLYFNTGIPMPKFKGGTGQQLKDEVNKVFIESLQRNVNARYSSLNGQINFDFYGDVEQKPKNPNLYMDMSIEKPNYSLLFLTHDMANFRINIPNSEIYRLGKTYFDLLLQSYNGIYNDIYRATKQFMDNYNLQAVTTAGKRNWYDLCKLSHSINKRGIE